jgi:hypothetical protein
MHACMHHVTCSVQHACRTLQRTRALYDMRLVQNQCVLAAPVRVAAWHGMQRRHDSSFTWAACCMLHVVRCTLHAAWCVCLCVRYAVGLGRRSGVGWLPSGCTRWARAGAVAHERVALAWLPCRRAAMRWSSPSWRSSEPKWRCRTPSGDPLDRAACTVQQTACKQDTQAACNGCPRPSHVQGA